MSLSSGCPTDLLAQHFYEEPAQYQQLLTMAFGSTEPPEKQGVVSIIVKLATFFRGSPQLLLALNTILSSGYALTFAPLPTISIPHSIDRVIFTMPDESCIVDLDLETRPSNDLLNTQNSHRATLPFRTTSQMCSFVAADEYHEMNLIVEAEDAPLVMELLQFELDRTQAASLRRRYLKSLRHLNRLHGVLPPSMYLRNIVCESEFPVSGGGFSDVWVGRLGEQRVCIKVLRMFMQHENKEKLLKSLSNEVILWRQLRHPNILPFLGINIELFRPSFCITSPWMSNGDIISYASKSSMSFKEKLDYAVQIAQGLAYLHELDPPVVHGDIKGANILITDDSRQCCLADFGLSVMDTQSFNPTHSATVQGSLRWLAPEFINPTPQPVQGSLITRDIYAFGCTVVELFTGAPPFSHHKLDIHVAIDVLNGVRPTLPDDLLRTITNSTGYTFIHSMLESCWSEKISHRPTARQIIEMLPIVSEGSGQLNIFEESNEIIDKDNELYATTSMPAKRGRGRPKGSKIKKSEMFSASTPSKKRGRPPKPKNPDDSEEEPSPKRKRARPPKPKPKNPDNSDEEPSPKRKRGRPPKPENPDDSEKEPSSKRKRGRPPKPENPDDSEEEPSPKRKRGRPPKPKNPDDSDEEPRPKRKRGRPPNPKTNPSRKRRFASVELPELASILSQTPHPALPIIPDSLPANLHGGIWENPFVLKAWRDYHQRQSVSSGTSR